ncbi:MAG: 3-oxoacyl-[acyl-carrier protein] reductase [Acetobacteraceae bacterium]|jgi:3-oxoacyl-[acyl-carrier protein] reductase|nr:3-oxoacyl-[acyl-carrier protein] reductase [Acetobacteraceae bacterium]MEA2777163.1 3-oxoacyl-[acyl-carrier protein] reductase [Acetobacteraceae bacterium]
MTTMPLPNALSMPSALSMQGRRALVTGAASGIGRATALALSQLGAELVICDRAPMDAVCDEIRGGGGTCTEARGDLTDDAFIASFFAGARLHAVAHCAGILEGRPWTEDDGWHERFHRVMDVNVRVPLQLAAAAISHMAAFGSGNIALVGSVAGKTGGTSLNTPPDYSASKGALHALVKWLSRNAVGRGVLVNAVAPGPVETPMTRGFNLGPTLPMGRIGRPEELAWPIAFLCTSAASYLSGAILDVNGGAFVGP